MAVSLAFATALFPLMATARSPSGKPAAPHRFPTAAASSPPVPRGTLRVTGGAARRLGRPGGRAVLAAVAAASRCQAAELRGRLRMGGVRGAVRGRRQALSRVPWMCALDTGPGGREKEWERKRSR
jgi:hypothetical protein